MKSRSRSSLAPALLLICLAAGCGKDAAPSKTAATNTAPASAASSGNPLTAPVDYLGAVAKAKTSSEKTIDLVSIRKAIDMFQTAEGRLPKDLQELVTEGHLNSVPKPPYKMKIVYDAATGVVKIVPE